MVIRRSAGRLDESKCHSYLHEGQEGGPREQQAGQPHLSFLEGDGTIYPGNHLQAQESHPGVISMDLPRGHHA